MQLHSITIMHSVFTWRQTVEDLSLSADQGHHPACALYGANSLLPWMLSQRICRRHLPKNFDNVHNLEFRKDADGNPTKTAIGMYSGAHLGLQQALV